MNIRVKLFPFLLICATQILIAEDNYIISQKGFFRLRATHQAYSFKNDFSFSEFSIPVEVYWPISRDNSLYLYTSHASVSGNDITNLSGLTDMQISWNYYLEEQRIVLNVGLGLPTGKSTLGKDEFTTSMLISQHYWNFNVQNFGQGFNLSPGVTWAVPLSDAAVAGLGLAYQIRGGFVPLKDMEMVYKPGNELLLTGGLDFRIGTLSTFTWDAIFTLYASDKMDDSVAYKSGNKIVTNLQFKTYFGYDLLTLSFRYRSKSKNQLLSTAGNLASEDKKTYPNQVELWGQYRHQHSPTFYMTYGVEGRFFQELDVYPGLNLLGGSIIPEVNLSKNTQLFGQFKIWTGTFSTDESMTGFELEAGLVFLF